MSCFHPRPAWLPLSDLGDGMRPVFRRPVNGSQYKRIGLPCRKCVGCRLDGARDLAIRASHEAQLHGHACFVTLTYDQANLPFRGMLSKPHFYKFWQDCKNNFRGVPLRYLGVGEYGSLNWRPHYHICIFGAWFDDAVEAGKSQSGFQNFESATLTRLWGKGRCVINLMSAEIAEYAARYALKKIGERDGYHRTDPITGDEYDLPPEFKSASKQLGRAWLDKYALDVFPHDYVVTRKGTKVPVPAYYVRVLREWCEEDFEALKARRMEKAAQSSLLRFQDGMPARLAVREEVLEARLARLSRRSL